MFNEKLERLFFENSVSKWGIVNDSTPLTYKHFKAWVERGDHGELGYLADERGEKRKDLREYFPEFSQALVFAFDYSKQTKILNDFYSSEASNGLKVGSYVLGFEGIDYHYFLRDRLNKISDGLRQLYPNLEIQFTLDTQPVLERDLALKGGLGWFGKNSMLINREIGSFYIIGSLLLSEKIIDKELIIDTDHCGNCTRCIDACPTDAIDVEKRTIIANKCISTFTIELFKESKAPEGFDQSGGEIYGCDICQDVCPWNIKAIKKIDYTDDEKENFFLKNKIVIDKFLRPGLSKIISDLESISNRGYRKELKKSPISRTGRVGMLKNLKALFQKSK